MNADVIIVGAGIIGTACGYFLSRLGLKVLILEHRHLCSGATGASAALITASGIRTPQDPIEYLTLESHRLIREIAQDAQTSIELIEGGSLCVAVSEQDARELQYYFKPVCKIEPRCKLLDADDARRMEPLLGCEVTGAFYNPFDFHVNPFRLCEGYLSAALRLGGRVEYGVQVYDVKIKNGRIDGVTTDQGDLSAEWVVVAGGAHTPRILSSAGIQVPVRPGRGQVIITEACPTMTNHIVFFMGHLYMKQTAAGNFYLGSATEFVGFDNHITLDKIASYSQEMVKAVPLLRKLRILRCFAGFRPISGDDLPIIGPVPDCPRLLIASGHGRNGICFSAVTGKAISELIVDGETELPVDMFGFDRFAGRTYR